MAITADAAALTQRHRGAQLALRAAALRDLQALWRSVDPTDLAGTIRPFALASSLVVRVRRRDSAAVAARYFRTFRRFEGLGLAPVALAAPLPAEVAEAQVRGAALAGVLRARQRGFSPQAAAQNGFVRTAGAATGLVLGGARETLLGAIQSDEEALGWQRSTSGKPCAFCAMVAARGAVFKDSTGASFQAHDHCSCTPEPFYRSSRPLPANERFREQWEATTKGRSGEEALNEFRRAVEGRAGD